MGTVNVSQILVTPLSRLHVKGGDVLHAIKRTDPGYIDFGEAYFSIIESNAIKAWKRHLRMTLNLVVPIGSVHFVFSDDQGNIFNYTAGERSYVRLTVPPGIWFGFKGLASPYSLLMNIADIAHDPQEIERKVDLHIDYDWENIL